MTSVLLLGGTTEATALADRLVHERGVDVLTSLAGATRRPAARAGRVRTGGFGGTAGLTAFLRERPVHALVDATHPFAAVMPTHAAAAARATGTPICRVLRPPWVATPGDRWRAVTDLPAAATAVAELGARRVLLTVGRQSTHAFAALDAWVLVRAIETPAILPARHELMLTRGPFTVDAERALLVERHIDAVVTKNSGGGATAAKLVAARELGLPVVMVARPPAPDVPTVADVDHAVEWLERTAAF